MVQATAKTRPAYPWLQQTLTWVLPALVVSVFVVVFVFSLRTAQTKVLPVPCAQLLEEGVPLWSNGARCNITEPIPYKAFVSFNDTAVYDFCEWTLPQLTVANNPTTGPSYRDLTTGPCISSTFAVWYAVQNQRMSSVALEPYEAITSTLYQTLANGSLVVNPWNVHTDVALDFMNLAVRQLWAGGLQGNATILRDTVAQLYTHWSDDLMPMYWTGQAISQSLHVDNDKYLEACKPVHCTVTTDETDWVAFLLKISVLPQVAFTVLSPLFTLVLDVAQTYRLKKIKTDILAGRKLDRSDEVWVEDYISGFLRLVELARTKGPLTMELLDELELGALDDAGLNSPLMSPHPSQPPRQPSTQRQGSSVLTRMRSRNPAAQQQAQVVLQAAAAALPGQVVTYHVDSGDAKVCRV